jgi:hypothetical protein
LLKRTTHSEEIASLSAQVSQLSELNQTLRTYLESLITAISPDKSKAHEVIKNESARLEEAQKRRELENNTFVQFMGSSNIPIQETINMIEDSINLEEFQDKIKKHPRGALILETLRTTEAAQRDFNEVRHILNKNSFSFEEFEDEISDLNPQKGVEPATHELKERRTAVGNKASRRSAVE